MLTGYLVLGQSTGPYALLKDQKDFMFYCHILTNNKYLTQITVTSQYLS